MTLLGLTHPAVRLQAILRKLTPGIPCSGPVDRSFLVAILPCVEQTSLYNSFNLSVWVLSLENSTCDALSVGMYLCPSDPDAAQLRRKAPNDFEWASLCDNSVMACTSYGGFNASRLANALPKRNQSCTVDPYSASRSDGLFGDVPPITSASIIDGLSQTLIAADKSISTVRSINDQADPYLRNTSAGGCPAVLGKHFCLVPFHRTSTRGNWGTCPILPPGLLPPQAFIPTALTGLWPMVRSGISRKLSTLRPSTPNI